MDTTVTELLQPKRFWSREEITRRNCGVPRQSGIYAWYFKEYPQIIPTRDCHKYGDLVLLYSGISPRNPDSRSNLRQKLRFHMRGEAHSSTLRLSLGCLLADRLGLELRVGPKGWTFADGEKSLSKWLSENALVAWAVDSKPWETEKSLIQGLSLPLNLKGNEAHPFYPVLSAIRDKAKRRARELPIVGPRES